jgi:hypothetical protein
MIAMLLLLSTGVAGKTIKSRVFLSDFKYGIKTTRKRSAYLSELKQRLSIKKRLVLMANSILF